jgi:hypothetical protein
LPLRSALIALAVLAVLMLGSSAWLVMSVDDGEGADGSHATPTLVQTANLSAVEDDEAGPAAPETGTAAGAGGSLSERTRTTLGSNSGSTGTNPQPNVAVAPSAPDAQPAPTSASEALSGLRISSQSWRRGGLGSRALVTFTLRNANTFAVKDLEISCAFSRRDGSHLTDRRRVVPGEVRSRSRKTFAAVHVGFVNVNASTAKCALVAASKI